MNEYEGIQARLCSNSRKDKKSVEPGRMGKRLLRHVLEAAQLFNRHGMNPVLDVGCGDGLGVAKFMELLFSDVEGVEVVQERVDVARSYGLKVNAGNAEDLSGYLDRSRDIFCSHTLEHVQDQKKAVEEIKRVAKKVVWIAVPIEFGGKSRNGAHFSPVGDLDMIRKYFPTEEWHILTYEYRWDLETEGVLAFVRQ